MDQVPPLKAERLTLACILCLALQSDAEMSKHRYCLQRFTNHKHTQRATTKEPCPESRCLRNSHLQLGLFGGMALQLGPHRIGTTEEGAQLVGTVWTKLRKCKSCSGNVGGGKEALSGVSENHQTGKADWKYTRKGPNTKLYSHDFTL